MANLEVNFNLNQLTIFLSSSYVFLENSRKPAYAGFVLWSYLFQFFTINVRLLHGKHMKQLILICIYSKCTDLTTKDQAP